MTNFNQFDGVEFAIEELQTEPSLSSDDLLTGLLELLGETELSLIERYAEENNLISSEEELSEQFDNMIEEYCPDFDTDDEPALSEAFNNWTDGLCKDGEIHEEQYSNYCYVGKYL